jgi:hypothetical protein
MKEIKISQVDALFSNGSYPIEFLFYYNDSFDTKRIRKALKALSNIFWPVFGEYKDGVIFFKKYCEEDYYDEVSLLEEFNTYGLKENAMEIYERFHLPDLKKLFFLKVLLFKKGMALIAKMNHIAGDGYSYFYFLSFLAMLSRANFVPLRLIFMNSFLKPHHKRTILRDFNFKGIELKPFVHKERFSIEFEEISREKVREFVKEVANFSGIRISFNDFLSAIAIKKLVRIQEKVLKDEVDLTIPIDVRQQIEEYGPRFFGNGIMLHTIKFKKDEIIDSSLEELSIKIRESMPLLSKEKYINYLESLERIISNGEIEKFKPFEPERGCLVTNLSKLPVSQLDFGKGAPEAVVPFTVERNSTGILSKGENFILRYAY